MTPLDRQLADDMAGFYDNPLGWALYAYDWGQGELEGWEGPDKWQTEVLRGIGKAIKEREPGQPVYVAVKSGRGIGKSALIAWIVGWLMSTRPNFSGLVTANTGAQLSSKTWREITLWTNRAINAHWFDVTATKIAHKEAPDTWRITAELWSENRPDSFGGLHNGGRGQAIIMDEGSGIPESIYDVSTATMTDPDSFVFVFGNPMQKRGRFYDLFTRFSHRWQTFTVDSRNAKAANQRQIQEAIEDWGGDSDYVRVNIKGEFPKQDADTLIPLPLIEAARTRKVEGSERYRPVWGLDVARYGDDRTSLCKRRHRVVRKADLQSWRGLNTMQTVGRVKAEWDECSEDDRPTHIIVDVIGVGAGVVDRLLELDLGDTIVMAVNVSESPAVKAKFHRLRDQMYWAGREWFETLAVQCEPEAIGGELGDVLYGFTSSGQIKVESKDAIKERLGRSPDEGEAFLLSLMRDCQVVSNDTHDRYRRARSRSEGSLWAA